MYVNRNLRRDGESEPSLPCKHFIIAILVFLLFPFFWLLLSALLTILIRFKV